MLSKVLAKLLNASAREHAEDLALMIIEFWWRIATVLEYVGAEELIYASEG